MISRSRCLKCSCILEANLIEPNFRRRGLSCTSRWVQIHSPSLPVSHFYPLHKFSCAYFTFHFWSGPRSSYCPCGFTCSHQICKLDKVKRSLRVTNGLVADFAVSVQVPMRIKLPTVASLSLPFDRSLAQSPPLVRMIGEVLKRQCRYYAPSASTAWQRLILLQIHLLFGFIPKPHFNSVHL